MSVSTSYSTGALKKKLTCVEQAIKSAQLRGFSAKRLFDARSQYIEILKKRGAL